jgi:hypothetical protein
MGPASEVGSDQIARLTEVMDWVQDFVKSGFVAQTESITVADICFVATYSTLEATGLLDLGKVRKKFQAFGYVCRCTIGKVG